MTLTSVNWRDLGGDDQAIAPIVIRVEVVRSVELPFHEPGELEQQRELRRDQVAHREPAAHAPDVTGGVRQVVPELGVDPLLRGIVRPRRETIDHRSVRFPPGPLVLDAAVERRQQLRSWD